MTSKEGQLVIESEPQYEYFYSFDVDQHVKFLVRKRPNPFHRLIQRWILGMYWGKNKK